MGIEYDLKKKIEKVIECAFQDVDKEKRKKFSWFRLEVQLKDKLSLNGSYNANTHKIVINNIADEGNNIKTLLHEVAHHIDWCVHGKTGHKKEFYDIYAKLLYSALDLDMVDYNQLKNMEKRSSDFAKVQKILENYVPHKSNKRNEVYLVQVLNGYEYKEHLKERNFYWNKVSKTWDTKIEGIDRIKEVKEQLRTIGVDDENILIKDDAKIIFSL